MSNLLVYIYIYYMDIIIIVLYKIIIDLENIQQPLLLRSLFFNFSKSGALFLKNK